MDFQGDCRLRCRLLNSLVLILGTVVPNLGMTQGQQLLRFRPPFGGLYQNLNPIDVPDNSFSILSDAALTSSGEIYKRGSFITTPIGGGVKGGFQ